MNPASPHSTDVLAIDRWLDGESNDREAAALEAAVAADSELASGVAARRAFLQRLAVAGRAHREALGEQLPAHVAARVRLALAGRRERRVPWPALAAAATVLLAVGAFLWTQKPEPAEAVPAAFLRAVDHAALGSMGPGTCTSTDEQHARDSTLVKLGNYQVTDCSGDAAEPSARLVRVEDLPVVGWAATRTTEEVRGPDLGMTVLRNHIVFDVARGRQREYLAVARSLYDELNKRHPQRASCIVCHNRSRDGQDNPHDIKLRRWK